MSVLCLNRTQAVRLGCTVGGLEHEIVDELAPFFVDLAAVRRDARLLVRQIGDERFLHPEHGVGVEIGAFRSEEHTSELQSLMRISYAVFCLKKKQTEPHPQITLR